MYNAKRPEVGDLPTTDQLLKSTALAIVIAIVLLVTVIMPSEYGVDPTGIGRMLGLTDMGEIKQQLAEEARQDEEAAVSQEPLAALVPAAEAEPVAAQPQVSEPVVAAKPAPAAEANVAATPEAANSEQVLVTLKPGEAAEIKLGMAKGAKVTYDWQVNTGHVNFDTHGDTKGIRYHGYGKGRKVTGDQGVLEAAFDGKHGWFWRNRSKETVTVTLNVSGDFDKSHRVL